VVQGGWTCYEAGVWRTLPAGQGTGREAMGEGRLAKQPASGWGEDSELDSAVRAHGRSAVAYGRSLDAQVGLAATEEAQARRRRTVQHCC
jgi:hypothetical protein